MNASIKEVVGIASTTNLLRYRRELLRMGRGSPLSVIHTLAGFERLNEGNGIGSLTKALVSFTRAGQDLPQNTIASDLRDHIFRLLGGEYDPKSVLKVRAIRPNTAHTALVEFEELVFNFLKRSSKPPNMNFIASKLRSAYNNILSSGASHDQMMEYSNFCQYLTRALNQSSAFNTDQVTFTAHDTVLAEAVNLLGLKWGNHYLDRSNAVHSFKALVLSNLYGEREPELESIKKSIQQSITDLSHELGQADPKDAKSIRRELELAEFLTSTDLQEERSFEPETDFCESVRLLRLKLIMLLCDKDPQYKNSILALDQGESTLPKSQAFSP